jgi:hypothetical protein
MPIAKQAYMTSESLMSRVSKLLSFAVIAACLSIVPRAFASAALQEVNSSQYEPHAPDATWALLLIGLFAVWAIATYANWDENAESSSANEYDPTVEPPLTAMGEWTAAEKRLSRIPPASETLSGAGGKSRVA